MTTVRIPEIEIGHHDLRERPEPAEAVDHRRLLEVLGDRLEEPHEEPGAEGDREGRVDEDQGPERVLEAQGGDDPGQGDEQERRRHEVREEDPDAEPLAPAAR